MIFIPGVGYVAYYDPQPHNWDRRARVIITYIENPTPKLLGKMEKHLHQLRAKCIQNGRHDLGDALIKAYAENEEKRARCSTCSIEK
jgi:hypothetical protein